MYSIFQAALGEIEFFNYFKTQLKIHGQDSWVQYLIYKYISQIMYLVIAALQTVAQYSANNL